MSPLPQNQQELRAQLPNGLHPRMASLPEYMCVPSPQYMPWVGGAVMAKLAAYQSHFMIKAEYEECGASCVHRKCA
jgi:actin-related protein